MNETNKIISQMDLLHIEVHQPRVGDIRKHFRALHTAKKFKNGTLEIFAAHFIADEPAIFGTPDQDYIRRELDWYNSQSLSIKAMEPPVPHLWVAAADKDGFANSNYGYLLYHSQNWSQYEHVKKALQADPNTRQAIAIYTRPSIHYEKSINGRNDMICTNAVQYAINDGKLDVHVQMRSNDAVYGYKCDFAWQKHVQEKLAAELRVPPGIIVWTASSLHVYERHLYLIGENDA